MCLEDVKIGRKLRTLVYELTRDGALITIPADPDRVSVTVWAGAMSRATVAANMRPVNQDANWVNPVELVSVWNDSLSVAVATVAFSTAPYTLTLETHGELIRAELIVFTAGSNVGYVVTNSLPVDLPLSDAVGKL